MILPMRGPNDSSGRNAIDDESWDVTDAVDRDVADPTDAQERLEPSDQYPAATAAANERTVAGVGVGVAVPPPSPHGLKARSAPAVKPLAIRRPGQAPESLEREHDLQ